ncbi:hypothetical protein UlMin_025869 [Ulmus minor]
MGHRHFNSSLQFLETDPDQYQSQGPAERSLIHMGQVINSGNGSSFHPMENTLMVEAYSAPQRQLLLRPPEHSVASIRSEGPQLQAQHSMSSMRSEGPQLQAQHSMSIMRSEGPPLQAQHSVASTRSEGPHLQAPVMGPSYVPSQHFHTVGCFRGVPESNAGHAHESYYNRNCVHDIALGAGRRPCKRSRPAISASSESGSTNTNCTAGSSNSFPEPQLVKPTLENQHYPPISVSLPHYPNDSLSIGGEGFQRNVRRRSGLYLEHFHGTNFSPHPYCPPTHLTNHSGVSTVDMTSLSLNTPAHEQNHITVSAAHGMSSIPGNNRVSHEMNHFPAGPSAADSGAYHHNSLLGSHPVPSPQYLNGVPTSREGGFNYSRRGVAQRRPSSGFHHPRPASTGGRYNNRRDRRLMIATERSESLPNGADALGRLGSGASMVIGHTLVNGPRSMFDQYQDMRLDVDNMTYEELLALGERIGTVSTGLSNDIVSECVVEITYPFSDFDQQEARCSICLEEYNYGQEKVGRMKKCGHDYHVECIREWLLKKNFCPICKVPASSDSLKDKSH